MDERELQKLRELAIEKMYRHCDSMKLRGVQVIHERAVEHCADPKCGKPFIPWRVHGGRKQTCCSPMCARRLRQRMYYKRRQK